MIGRILGVTAAVGAAALWAMFLYRNPYAAPDGGSFLLGVLMILGAAIAAVAAGVGAHLAMYLLFIVMFFPVGFYVMLGPGVFKAIGWCDLIYLGAAVLTHRAVRSR